MFQSTHSLRSATQTLPWSFQIDTVSIHALLAECDGYSYRRNENARSFNPRTPCGVRPKRRNRERAMIRFQSTHSLRSATLKRLIPAELYEVSIHALLAECDMRSLTIGNQEKSFNPRTPCGVRPHLEGQPHAICTFQSTHSLRSATLIKHIAYYPDYVSIHALLAECDVMRILRDYRKKCFNPRTPCGVRPV